MLYLCWQARENVIRKEHHVECVHTLEFAFAKDTFAISKPRRHSWSIRTRSGAMQFRMCNLDAKAGLYFHVPQPWDFACVEPRIFILILSRILYFEMKELLPAMAILCCIHLKLRYTSDLPSWPGQKAHEISYDCVWEIKGVLNSCLACFARMWGPCPGVYLQTLWITWCITWHYAYRYSWPLPLFDDISSESGSAIASHRLDSRTGLDGIMNYLQLWNVVTRFTWSASWQVELFVLCHFRISLHQVDKLLAIQFGIVSNCVFWRFDHEGSLSLTGWLAYYHLGRCMHPSGR